MATNATKCSCDGTLIDVSGICNPQDTTEVIRLSPYWKQLYLSETLLIPSEKPDIEQINSINVSVSILRKKVIQTPRSYGGTALDPVPLPNLEGRLLSGRKLLIEGQLCQQVSYTACETSQSVHSATFYVPFSAYIVVPLSVPLTVGGVTVPVDSLEVNYEVTACLEDVAACVLDSRTILKQVTLLLNAVPLGIN